MQRFCSRNNLQEPESRPTVVQAPRRGYEDYAPPPPPRDYGYPGPGYRPRTPPVYRTPYDGYASEYGWSRGEPEARPLEPAAVDPYAAYARHAAAAVPATDEYGRPQRAYPPDEDYGRPARPDPYAVAARPEWREPQAPAAGDSWDAYGYGAEYRQQAGGGPMRAPAPAGWHNRSWVRLRLVRVELSAAVEG